MVPGGDEPPFDEGVRLANTAFFPMFDVPFLYGQPWSERDDQDHASVIVIGRELNDRLFAGENSVGRSLQLNDNFFKIVGVLDDDRTIGKTFAAADKTVESPW